MQKTYEDPVLNFPLAYFVKPDGIITDTICAETMGKRRMNFVRKKQRKSSMQNILWNYARSIPVRIGIKTAKKATNRGRIAK